ncbi:hypothetical protein NHH73_17125 [Oxalobacteraceae bacterium OTU3CINTB1]|nr:hypothetical protein NHH73_17125 [Oxalobacteraceae bacterium OTU3CINTB1]
MQKPTVTSGAAPPQAAIAPDRMARPKVSPSATTEAAEAAAGGVPAPAIFFAMGA